MWVCLPWLEGSDWARRRGQCAVASCVNEPLDSRLEGLVEEAVRHHSGCVIWFMSGLWECNSNRSCRWKLCWVVNVDEWDASTIGVLIPIRNEAYTYYAVRYVMQMKVHPSSPSSPSSVMIEIVLVCCGNFENWDKRKVEYVPAAQGLSILGYPDFLTWLSGSWFYFF
jgi:hypothetical protein